jgi:glycosyltransferase involved in cell wall biosynthesis
LKVLIVAQNASSRIGGEAFLPLKYFQLMRRRGMDVSLISHQRNQADLTNCLGADIARVRFIADTRWHLWLNALATRLPERGFGQLINMLMGVVDEYFLKAAIRSFLAQHEVDVIHQPTPVSPRAPSFIYGFTVPVVIGPMNGNMTYPPGYREYQPRWARWIIGIGRPFAIVLNRVFPGKRRAAALIVANRRTREALPVEHPARIIELVENGVDFTIWKRRQNQERRTEEFRLIYLGRLVEWKAVDLTLKAVALARSSVPGLHLDIVGDGPETERLKALAEDLHLTRAVTFHGFLPQPESAGLMQGSNALILNSLFECGGAVILEAMSLGLPVIASDWGGPADYLDGKSGILVSPVPRESFVARLADAIERLALAPDLAREMGEAGAARVRKDFGWEEKIDRMIEIYAEVIADEARK